MFGVIFFTTNQICCAIVNLFLTKHMCYVKEVFCFMVDV